MLLRKSAVTMNPFYKNSSSGNDHDHCRGAVLIIDDAENLVFSNQFNPGLGEDDLLLFI